MPSMTDSPKVEEVTEAYILLLLWFGQRHLTVSDQVYRDRLQWRGLATQDGGWDTITAAGNDVVKGLIHRLRAHPSATVPNAAAPFDDGGAEWRRLAEDAMALIDQLDRNPDDDVPQFGYEQLRDRLGALQRA